MNITRVVLLVILSFFWVEIAIAGGFPLDPKRCPTGDWYPEPDLPAQVVTTLCSFLDAIDSGNMEEAYSLLASERFGQSLEEFAESLNPLDRGSGTIPPERYIMDIHPSSDNIYKFVIQVMDRDRWYVEDIYISAATNRVVGLRISDN